MNALNSEMIKLRESLDKIGIEWRDDSKEDDGFYIDNSIARTKFVINGYEYSVIHGYATFGGWVDGKEDEGLLEIRMPGGDVKGYLKADEVIRIIQLNESKIDRIISERELYEVIADYPHDTIRKSMIWRLMSKVKTHDPDKHGHWKGTNIFVLFGNFELVECSLCKERLDTSRFAGCSMNYCPNCGAKMDEVSE